MIYVIKSLKIKSLSQIPTTIISFMPSHIFKIITDFPLIIFKALNIIALHAIKNVICVFNYWR